MEDIKHELIPVDKKTRLVMRCYKNEAELKGIIVFVHGVSHGAWCWVKFVDYFTKRGYVCFTVNLRGHGDDRGNNKYIIKRLKHYVADVSRCIDHCKTYCEENGIPYSKPSLLGHSMGGGIVEIYMNEHSDKIKNAILFAPATAQGMKKSFVAATFSKTAFCYTLPTIRGCKPNKNLQYSNFFIAKTDDKNFTPRITDEKELALYDILLGSENIFAMFGLSCFKLNKPNIPVFVIGSDKDAYFPTESLSTTADFYETIPMILRGLCHDMMLDPEWDKAAQSVLEFIEKPDVLKEDPQTFIEDLEKKIYPEGTE